LKESFGDSMLCIRCETNPKMDNKLVCSECDKLPEGIRTMCGVCHHSMPKWFLKQHFKERHEGVEPFSVSEIEKLLAYRGKVEMLPDTFHERRNDQPEPETTPKESALEAAYNKMVTLICPKCGLMKHKQRSHPIMVHYACYTDVRHNYFIWGALWGIFLGFILAVLIVG